MKKKIQLTLRRVLTEEISLVVDAENFNEAVDVADKLDIGEMPGWEVKRSELALINQDYADAGAKSVNEAVDFDPRMN